MKLIEVIREKPAPPPPKSYVVELSQEEVDVIVAAMGKFSGGATAELYHSLKKYSLPKLEVQDAKGNPVFLLQMKER